MEHFVYMHDLIQFISTGMAVQTYSVKRNTINFSSTWKKKYFVLKRFREAVHLFYYDNKPKTSREEPKGMTDYLLNDFIQVMVRTVHKTQ